MFRYRATDNEFTALKQAFQETLHLHRIHNLITHDLHFPALFVFYAADWWRRECDGKWEWAAITESLDDEWDWTRDERAKCVEKGLHDWRLERTASGALRYLQAIALQGGLPLKLLSEARGGLGDVLQRTLALAKGKAVSRDDLLGWIRSLERRLPKSYRKDAVLELLADVIETTLSLVGEAQITASTDAIAQLDEHKPEWRHDFPLPVDDDAAQALIERLIRDASQTAQPRTFDRITLDRSLHPIDQDEWTLQAHITVPEAIDAEALQTWFEIPKDVALPRQLVLETISGNTTMRLPLHRLAGNHRYVCDEHIRPIDGADAAAACHMRLTCGNGHIWNAQPRRSERLEDDHPWVFVTDADDSRRLHHQGGGKVAAREAWIAVPSAWEVQGAAELTALIATPERAVYRITGDHWIHTDTSDIWRLQTGQTDVDGPEYHWVGKRSWLEFSSPDMAFHGLPTLYDGPRRIPTDALTWNETGGQVPGPRTATYTHAGELQLRVRVLILPDKAGIRLQPNGPLEGDIHFDHWRLAGIAVRTPDIEYREEKHTDGATLRLKYTGDQRTPPADIELELAWPDHPTPARLRLPFPALGARLFDADGFELENNAGLSVDRLTGTRLIASGNLSLPELRFTLQHTQTGCAPAEIVRLKPPPAGHPLELRPLDHRERMQRLLGSDETLDDQVEVSLHANHHDRFRFHVSRYCCDLEPETDAVRIPHETASRIHAEQLRALPVQALRLESPGDEAETLPLIESEGVPTGAWSFDAARFGPGHWLIHPGQNAACQFRPTLWPVPGGETPQSRLTRALAMADASERQCLLDEAIATLAANYAEPDWNDLERLAYHLGRLPLPTLDLWRRCAHHPVAMTALAIRMHRLPDGFLRRFATELPFIWSVIPMAEWVRAMRRCIRQAEAWGTSASVYADHLADAIKRLARIEPCLDRSLHIAKDIALGKTPQALTEKHRLLDAYWADALILNRESSKLQQLLHTRKDDTWLNAPVISDLIEAFAKQPGSRTLLPSMERMSKETATTICLPILLAYGCAANTLPPLLNDPRTRNDIRRYQDFDLDWFTEAFNHTITRCVSRGLLTVAPV